MAASEFLHLKNMQVSMSDGKMVEDTKVLDGEAQGNGFLDGTNETKQYKTANIPKGNLGGENDLNG